jgi:hypothetical protein
MTGARESGQAVVTISEGYGMRLPRHWSGEKSVGELGTDAIAADDDMSVAAESSRVVVVFIVGVL